MEPGESRWETAIYSTNMASTSWAILFSVSAIRGEFRVFAFSSNSPQFCKWSLSILRTEFSLDHSVPIFTPIVLSRELACFLSLGGKQVRISLEICCQPSKNSSPCWNFLYHANSSFDSFANASLLILVTSIMVPSVSVKIVWLLLADAEERAG